MKQLTAYIAQSIDGYIASANQGLDWLPESVQMHLGRLCTTAEVLLIGYNTYNYINAQHGKWPYVGTKTYVVSHHAQIGHDAVEYLSNLPLMTIRNMKQEASIVVVGSGQLVHSLLEAQLIDILELYTIPVILGSGVRFQFDEYAYDRYVTSLTPLKDGVLQTTYQLFGVEVCRF